MPQEDNKKSCKNIYPCVEVPEKLLLHLKYGLKNTPLVQVQPDILKKELLGEAVLFCKQMYRSRYGFLPKLHNSDTFDEKLLSIISQCSTNSSVVKKIADFRTAFVESLPLFLSIQNNDGMV